MASLSVNNNNDEAAPKKSNVAVNTQGEVEQLVRLLPANGGNEREMLKVLARKPYDFYKRLRELPDSIAKEFHKDLVARWNHLESSIKVVEDKVIALNAADGSLEEGRVEIMAELLDKACQAFEIHDEHENRNIPYGHRLVLEANLLEIIESSFNLVREICDNFSSLLGDADGVSNERDMIRLEIRLCDVHFSEIHEKFLKSYLEMEW